MRTVIAFLLLIGITVSFKKATDGPPKVSQHKAITTISDKHGIISKAGNSTYIIFCRESNMSFTARNIPGIFQKDSLAVVFSGVVKESLATEDKPNLVLSSIRKN